MKFLMLYMMPVTPSRQAAQPYASNKRVSLLWRAFQHKAMILMYSIILNKVAVRPDNGEGETRKEKLMELTRRYPQQPSLCGKHGENPAKADSPENDVGPMSNPFVTT